ncbi:uncharacterized protein LOC141708330 isoform X4 [Apium graveolens]|uniref:uncharacterized protein LOC141708330 isoform X4 n=1 Tax=Apium graveolens TaxID=4045 RepID=UPI003D795027
MMSWIPKILKSLKRLIIKYPLQQRQVHGGRKMNRYVNVSAGFAVYYRYPNSQCVTYGQFIKVRETDYKTADSTCIRRFKTT